MSYTYTSPGTRNSFCCIPSPAYIDPGAGSMIFQMLIVGALGSLYFLKTFWGRLLAFFTRPRKKGRTDDE
ncbi:MAG TPA: hypothetical protein PLN86_11535 [Candidatus Hydrogenedentes bacterium]|nr:hypothetical protein [Candidatus Hydrogenedentota bacterium]